MILMLISRLIALCICMIFCQVSFCQDFTKFWGSASYFSQYEKLLYTIEPQIRLIDRTGTYEMSLLNAGLGTKLASQFNFWLGQTYINYSNTNNIAEDVSKETINEYRIWEQLMWRRPFADIFASRFRVEQRRAFQSSEWSVRVRERAYLTIPLKDKFSFALSDEIFLNIKSAVWVSTSTFDQNRLFVGVFYNFTPNIGLNISYLNQFIPRTPAEVNNGLILNLVAYMY